MSYNCKEDVKPQEGRQTTLFNMIANQEADFFMVGGSRFGGKTEVISMVDLLFAGDPKFRSIKFRRSYDEIMGPNGLWEKAENQYKLFNAKPNKTDKTWTWPSGAKSVYRHMFHEGDEESHRGKGYSAVMFDEVNQFTWDQVRMLQTCLRSEADMNSFMIGTLNPDPNSWCMRFVEWYLDSTTGYPDTDKCGKVRYYIVVDGIPIFGPDEQFFSDNHWEMVNPIINPTTGERLYVRPKRFVFFFFNIFDNTAGMKQNPQYITELNGLPTHERDTQLFGNWFSQPKGSSMFRREFLKGLNPEFPSKLPEGCTEVRAWDKAYKEVSEKSRYPDYTASIKMFKSSNGEYYIAGNFAEDLHDDFKEGEDIIYGRFRKNVGLRNSWMLQQAILDGDQCTVVIPEESGAGVAEYEQMRTMFTDEGFKVIAAPTGNKAKGKGLRFSAFCVAAEQGAVHILVDTFPNMATLDTFLVELEKFDPDGKSTATRKDDWVDATSDCFLALQKVKVYLCPSIPRLASKNTELTRLRKDIS